MKTTFFKLSLLTLAIIFTSCDKDDLPENIPLDVKLATNIYAPQAGGQGQPVSGEFTRFSFAENDIVTNSNWDIAFRGSTIIVNGGSLIGITDEPTRTGIAAASSVSNTLAGVTLFPDATTFLQDATNTYAIPTGSNNGWYNYNSSTHLIAPIAGKIFVIKTHDGKYAKFEILSYYKNAPATPDPTIDPSGYYTFNFVYQPNSTTTF